MFQAELEHQKQIRKKQTKKDSKQQQLEVQKMQ
jgi:hypothetical protein